MNISSWPANIPLDRHKEVLSHSGENLVWDQILISRSKSTGNKKKEKERNKEQDNSRERGEGHFHAYIALGMCRARPPFSALKIRSGASSFYIFCRSGDHDSWNFFTVKKFQAIRRPQPAYCSQPERFVFGQRSGSGVSGLPECQSDTSVSSGDPTFSFQTRAGAPAPHFHARARSGAPPPPHPRQLHNVAGGCWQANTKPLRRSDRRRGVGAIHSASVLPGSNLNELLPFTQFRCRIILVSHHSTHSRTQWNLYL